jgi:hypothetical protein
MTAMEANESSEKHVNLRSKFSIVALLLFVSSFEWAWSHWQMMFMDWFWLHVELVFAVLILGAVLWFPRRSRRVSWLLPCAGVMAALAGIGTYLLYPLFESARPPATDRIEALANALGDALGPVYFATIAMAAGLFLGWLPAWFYLRAHTFFLGRARTNFWRLHEAYRVPPGP